MANNSNASGRGPRFTIRQALAATLLVALALGWYSTAQNASRQIAALSRCLEYAKVDAPNAKERDKAVERVKSSPGIGKNGAFVGVDLRGANLKGVSIVGGPAAFQLAILNDADLQNASLTGSFQLAHFDRANLAGAKLTGGSASFQDSSFVEADLSGATLSGAGASFQAASFRRAKLVGARIVGNPSFQEVNIDGANFQGADLSSIRSEDLRSCIFDEPPSYDDKTRFPSGFDPAVEGWKQVPSA